MHRSLFSLLLVLSLWEVAVSDTPANCTYSDYAGTWIFHEGAQTQGSNIQCAGVTTSQLTNQLRVTLSHSANQPTTAMDSAGHKGTWTIIYNQGFEVIINNRRYFAFSNWTMNGNQTVSLCHQTLPGWAHDIHVREWSCFIGQKATTAVPKVHTEPNNMQQVLSSRQFVNNPDFIRQINEKQDSWEATEYADWEGITQLQALRKMGGEKSRIRNRPGPAPITAEQQAAADALPTQFDWRSARGQNFVSPIRNQGRCGSCYAFASAAMLEARIRIFSNNTQTPVFSPQDVLQCTAYSQGCAGGFPYLIGGKYAEDFGMVLEQANPYHLPEPNDNVCHTDSGARRYYATNYSYVGGYYGGCNAAAMKIELVNNGPIAVGFEVYHDFRAYKNGVYHHTFVKDTANMQDQWDPFVLVNHAVLVIGYGTNSTTNDDYWIVKNSWGPNWGDSGYFKIRRGNDECGIESLGVRSTPIVPYSYVYQQPNSASFVSSGISVLFAALINWIYV